jgi:DNA-directed RNA polymerase subunit RPC12/RpoP
MAIDTPDCEAEVRRPAAPSGSTMPNPSLLRVNAVDSDGFLRCPSCGARVLATVQLMVRPALRIGPKGLGLFARNFASRRRIEREPLTEATMCRCQRCDWSAPFGDHPAIDGVTAALSRSDEPDPV